MYFMGFHGFSWVFMGFCMFCMHSLSQKTLLHTTLSHTAFRTRLFHIEHCHAQPFLVAHSTSHTHRALSHTQLFHTQPYHTQFCHTICLLRPIFTPALSLLEEVDMRGLSAFLKCFFDKHTYVSVTLINHTVL